MEKKVIPINGRTQEQQQAHQHEYSPLGHAVLDAIDDGARTTEEIAEIVREPICVVFAMLGHLSDHGVVESKHEPEPQPQPKKGRRQS